MIRRNFQEMQVSHQEVEIAATLSIGAAIFPAHGATGEAVLACADQALYQAKHSGRNRVVIWQAPGVDQKERYPFSWVSDQSDKYQRV
jgi:diguanylate cyclase (GGDEF)-like protein